MRFLVVDPLAGVQSFARQLLQSHGHAAENVVCCADTDSALAQGLVFKPQVLVTDWSPKAGLTGPLLYQRLREVQPAIQLGLLSFDVTAEHEFEAEAHGAKFLLKKPFTAEQFKAELSRLEGVLPPAQAPRAAKPVTQRPVLPAIKPPPVIKPGDRFRYEGSVRVAQHVVHRHGETVVQLQGLANFVPLEKLQPA